MAVRVGQVLAAWRRRRAVAKQDAFVLRWKTAWAEGYHDARQGVPRTTVPYGQDDQRAAWLAGWQWAENHPTLTDRITWWTGALAAAPSARAAGSGRSSRHHGIDPRRGRALVVAPSSYQDRSRKP